MQHELFTDQYCINVHAHTWLKVLKWSSLKIASRSSTSIHPVDLSSINSCSRSAGESQWESDDWRKPEWSQASALKDKSHCFLLDSAFQSFVSIVIWLLFVLRPKGGALHTKMNTNASLFQDHSSSLPDCNLQRGINLIGLNVGFGRGSTEAPPHFDRCNQP